MSSANKPLGPYTLRLDNSPLPEITGTNNKRYLSKIRGKSEYKAAQSSLVHSIKIIKHYYYQIVK